MKLDQVGGNKMTWFSILKETRQISQSGIKTKLGTEPLTISDEDDDDCCENAREQYQEWMDNGIYRDTWGFTSENVIRRMSCEELEEEMFDEVGELQNWYENYDFWDNHLDALNFEHPLDLIDAANSILDILDEWNRCRNEKQ